MRNSKDTKTQDQDKDEKVNDKEPGMQREGFRHDSTSGKTHLCSVEAFKLMITLCLTDCFQSFFDSKVRFYFEDYLKSSELLKTFPQNDLPA